MSYPKQIKARRKIEALTGIKSSLDKIRSVIALVYILYVANKRKSFVKYSVSSGSKISIDPKLLESIENLIGRKGLGTIINNNPLITNQYEPLYVGVTLLMKLGYLKMEGRQNTAERTGGVRFPKQLYFANNTLVLDLILIGIPENVRYSSLYEWLQNKKATSSDFEERVSMFLSTCTVFTQFKLRDDSFNEIFFQTEGIYAALREGNNDVVYNDSHEFVGPTRIYNNVLREGLEPWIEINKSILSFSEKSNPDADSMGAMISTTLDIHNVNYDALVTDDNTEDGDIDCNNETATKDYPLQQIYYGAPGTGKSHRIKEIIQENGIDEKEQVFRTTFHPDSDYSTFVGCYKPIMKSLPQTYVVEGKEKPVIDIATGSQSEKEEIVYDYTPQAFIQAYTKAWTTPNKPVILVIEEINRGNCAQIFGDIFQLLDRGDDNVSDYEIKPDKALEDYLKGYFAKINDVEIPERIKSGEIMKLPSNLYIWATMNTSDQSLFPIDSAFKRRWDWVYMPIDTRKEIWHIKIGESRYPWTGFLEKINNDILTDETAEDKHLGFYFCKAENNEITQETFVGKVLFYLWNDVFKVYGIPSVIGSSKEWAYTKFYNTDGKVNEQKVKDLMAKLQINPEGSNENAAEEVSE